MSKWGKIAWSKGRGEDDGEGIEGGRRRKPLDPVEIMQKGFEKCLACVIAEVGHPFVLSSSVRGEGSLA